MYTLVVIAADGPFQDRPRTLPTADLNTEEKVERCGRGWADTFREDIVMMVEEE